MKFEIVGWLEPMIDHFWNNKKEYLAMGNNGDEFVFDYPDYGGLPKKISSKLTSEQVDVLQEVLLYALRTSRSKTAFAQYISESLARDLIIVKR